MTWVVEILSDHHQPQRLVSPFMQIFKEGEKEN